MATNDLKAIKDGLGMIGYCQSPTGKLKREPAGERVQFVCSTFTAGTNLDGIAAELKMNAGRAADAYHFRIAFSPGDRKLSETEFRSFVEKITGRVLPGRSFLAVCHGDTEHQHIHVVSSFLDGRGRALNFKGSGKHNFAVKRQSAVDEVTREFDLSTLEREEGRYRRAQDHVSLRVVRASERGEYIWTDDLKNRISAAEASAHDIPSFVAELEKLGIEGRLRGQGISYSFIDSTSKKRISRGRKLGEQWTLQSIESRINNEHKETNMDKTEKMERGRELAQQYAAAIWEQNHDIPTLTAEEEKTAAQVAREIKEKPKSKADVKRAFNAAKSQGVDLSGIVSAAAPAALIQAGQGNPIPLIMSLAKVIAAAGKAAEQLRGISGRIEEDQAAQEQTIQAVCWLWAIRDEKGSPDEKAIRIANAMESGQRWTRKDIERIFENAERHGVSLEKVVDMAPAHGIKTDHDVLSLSRKLGQEIKLAEAATKLLDKPGLSIAQGRAIIAGKTPAQQPEPDAPASSFKPGM